MKNDLAALAQIIRTRTDSVVARWLDGMALPATGGRGAEGELRAQCRDFLDAFAAGLAAGAPAATDEAYGAVRAVLDRVSRTRATQGFTPRETATFIFSLKEPLFDELMRSADDDARAVMAASWRMSTLLDQFGLYTMEVYSRSRDELIRRQQDEIAELSTPVVKLWEGILALPLIGTLDSSRTQVVMESLLQAIVDQGAGIAIIDITGVPTVDTQVAQHLLKTIAAARLMGADCIISGIRPQIAQTMVHLGVELDVVSKATLADALALALRRTGRMVARRTDAS